MVAQRHLWQSISDSPNRDSREVYLDEPVSIENLFGQSLDAIQAKFEQRMKQREALCNIIPGCTTELVFLCLSEHRATTFRCCFTQFQFGRMGFV